MEGRFRSFKTAWLPPVGYLSAQEARREISHDLMHRYHWIRPYPFNSGLAPAVAEKNLTHCPGLVDHYSSGSEKLEPAVSSASALPQIF